MKRIRLGMIGGGPGAMIGQVHRLAARMDGRFDLVGGVFSSDPDKGATFAQEIGSTAFASEAEMLHSGQIDAVAIVTPNHLHVPSARAALRAGIHVICDKPMGISVAECRALEADVAASGRVFVLTHNYTGYPMVRQARHMVRSGQIGTVQQVQVEYPQDWLARDAAGPRARQAAWRLDPARSGPGGALSDIGTHGHHLMRFITGLEITQLLAITARDVAQGGLDDSAQVTLRLDNRAMGALWCSQTAAGAENGLRIRIFGSDGALDWRQEDPDRLLWSDLSGPRRELTRGSPDLCDAATSATMLGRGHPEGFFAAFATIYRDAADEMLGLGPTLAPGVSDGTWGLRFVEACARSAQKGGTWVDI
ncbi:putative dehydrogenase [Rubricella aquisinus]|uniref:Putative dehydrogenase n=1 Tax=Rubricella aquisinus TaxID=2028108 RepID=A0A840WJ01_9RHOB|nr:Gfo/Idh/MocA family oxidoreductase [Rubricella aquisinus]MBB5515088.1 putative dehydrogenase [Rubricella aquisinus]